MLVKSVPAQAASSIVKGRFEQTRECRALIFQNTSDLVAGHTVRPSLETPYIRKTHIGSQNQKKGEYREIPIFDSLLMAHIGA
jgi:hypothetical protein